MTPSLIARPVVTLAPRLGVARFVTTAIKPLARGLVAETPVLATILPERPAFTAFASIFPKWTTLAALASILPKVLTLAAVVAGFPALAAILAEVPPLTAALAKILALAATITEIAAFAAVIAGAEGPFAAVVAAPERARIAIAAMRPAAVPALVGKAALGEFLLAVPGTGRPLLAAASVVAPAPRVSVVFIFVAGHERLSWSGQNAIARIRASLLSQKPVYTFAEGGPFSSFCFKIRDMNAPSFMNLALKAAETAEKAGEVPIGCVIVRDGVVVASAGNRTLTDRDPTAHAEILAIRAAAEEIGSERLVDCDLYVTLEPCTMCAAAISFARIRRLYYGAADPKGGAIDSGVRFYASPTCHHVPQVYSAVGESEAAAMLKAFFRARR